MNIICLLIGHADALQVFEWATSGKYGSGSRSWMRCQRCKRETIPAKTEGT